MLQEINLQDLQFNPFTLFHNAWALITAGQENNYNTMTASWGELGILWNRPICTVFVRPQRYTHEFMEKNDTFTVSFYADEYRDALTYCGRNSGRDVDKAKETGLTPVHEDNTTYFKEATLVFECKKIYKDDIKPNHFIDETIHKNYPEKDYHDVYIGEIVKVLINK